MDKIYPFFTDSGRTKPDSGAMSNEQWFENRHCHSKEKLTLKSIVA